MRLPMARIQGLDQSAQDSEPQAGEGALWVAMYFDHHCLWLAQQELCSLESVLDVQRQDRVAPAVGVINWAGQDWPVFCLGGADLAVMIDLPASRRVCLLLDNGQQRIAMVCDRIEMLAQSSRQYDPLPPCMDRSGALVAGLIVHDETVNCLTTAARLASFCQRATLQGAKHG